MQKASRVPFGDTDQLMVLNSPGVANSGCFFFAHKFCSRAVVIVSTSLIRVLKGHGQQKAAPTLESLELRR